jgi:transposase
VCVGTLLPPVPRCDDATQAQLLLIATRPTSPQRLAQRAKLVLAVLIEGFGVREAALRHQVSPNTVRKWTTRFQADGIEGLADAPRSGRPRSYDDDAVRDLCTLATSTPPAPFALWSHARLAQAMGNLNWGVTASWVTRTLAALGLKVHRVKGWLHRREDPDFESRVAAVQSVIAGTGTNAGDDPYPVFSLDEKTAYSVRTPIRPDSRSRSGVVRREFEYVRGGTLSWYGVQNVITGAVQMIRAKTRMDSAAFVEVLQGLIDEQGDVFTLVMDNGSAHTSRQTRAWLGEHPGIRVVHTPFHASWVNPIESRFGILARQVLKHGWFTGPDDCDRQVQLWAADRNRHRRPVTFTWQPAT